MKELIQRSFSIPADILEKIRKDAQKEYSSESSIVRKILVKYYEEKENDWWMEVSYLS